MQIFFIVYLIWQDVRGMVTDGSSHMSLIAFGQPAAEEEDIYEER